MTVFALRAVFIFLLQLLIGGAILYYIIKLAVKNALKEHDQNKIK